MNEIIIFLTGLIASTFASALGLGWGMITIPILIGFLKLEPKQAVAAILIGGIGVSITGGLAHYKLGNVNIPVVSFLLIGSAIGGFLGSLLSTEIPADILRRIIAIITIALGIKILI